MVLADWCAGLSLITCEARNLGARVIFVVLCCVWMDGFIPCINSFCSSVEGRNRERERGPWSSWTNAIIYACSFLISCIYRYMLLSYTHTASHNFSLFIPFASYSCLVIQLPSSQDGRLLIVTPPCQLCSLRSRTMGFANDDSLYCGN